MMSKPAYKFFLIFLSFLVKTLEPTNAQYQVLTETYSVEDGLAQNTVTDMTKGREGFLWFTTRDGLSRFDGYNFKNYKAGSKEMKRSISNEFQQVVRDDYGFLWILNYMGQVFRFDPRKETFELYPPAEENRGDNYISVRKLIKTSVGDIWMLGAGNGCIRARTNRPDFSVKLTVFCTREQSKTGHNVHSVYCDSEDRVWILTENGIAVVGKNENEPSSYFLNSRESEDKNSLSAALETNDEILVSGSQGKLYRYNKNKRRFTVFRFPVKSELNNILAVNNSTCFLSTNESGFFLFNYRNGNYTHFQSGNTQGLASNDIDISWKAADGNIWMRTRNEIFCRYDVVGNKVCTMPFKYAEEDQELFSSDQGSSLFLSFIDEKEKLWLMPSLENPAWYDEKRSSQLPLLKEKEKMFPSIVYKTFADTTGVFWQATHYNGVQKCVALNSSFRFTQFKNSIDYTEENDITAFFEDDKLRLWIAARNGKIRLLDNNNQLLGYLNRNGEITKTESEFAHVQTIYQDCSGRIWLGAASGLYRLESQTTASLSYKVRNYALQNYEEQFAPLSLDVNNILEDNKGHLWLTTADAGLHLLDERSGKIRFIHKNNLFKNSYPPTVLQTKCLSEDSYGNIWVGSGEGITVFSSEFQRPEDIKFFFYNPENTDLVNSNISDIYQDKDETIWFTSFGGGLFRISGTFYLGETPDFMSYNKENNHFPSDLALSAGEDEHGFLWVVTEDAIVKFNKQNAIYELFGKVNGLDHIGFSEQHVLKRQSGEFIVGTASGFYSLFPQEVKQTKFKPEIVLTRFQLFNKDVSLNEEKSPLKSTINNTEEIMLTHNQNVFSIEYAALDFRNPAYIQYAYKLDNFENDWNYVGSQRVASYTNLPKGTYYFRIKSTNSEGIWFDNDKVLKITILPSFWETGWAYLLYVLAAIVVIGGTIAAFMINYRLRTRMKLESEMSAMKLQFFTDVSHELRTPLTLINAPLEKVLEDGNLSKDDREQLQVVHTNTNRMLRLMNQILDFRKIQNNKMRLRVEKTKLGEFIVSCCSNFLKMAENRNVKFEIEDDTHGAFFWIDRDKMDTVMFNLLSNAFKFTPSGKSVKVSVFVENDEAVIQVKDEGSGIPKDKQAVIFDRYVTLHAASLTKQSGTGIGLSLVKEIVEMHKAFVTVNSSEKNGSIFEIRLKPGMAHFDEQADIIVSDEELPDKLTTGENAAKGEEDDAVTLLVIEDNEELRRFLVSVLSKKFNVIEAENGEIGWEKTITHNPDFVITDIMMPVLDGIAYTRRVRENERTSHIPIILLTAKTDMESKLECLKIGANDYITKPFSMSYLETRVENILEERKKWQNKYKNELLKTRLLLPEENIRQKPDEPEEQKAETQDDILMRNLVAYIEKNMDNSEFSVDDMMDELKISRWNLMTKVKALVGLTPTELIRETRLSHAAKLIEKGEFNMSQITYMIGMTDSRYFSRMFKQKFGMTPTEYKNKAGKRT